MKYRVLKKCSLVVEKDSVVELDPVQANLAQGFVLPIVEEQKKETPTPKRRTTKKGE